MGWGRGGRAAEPVAGWRTGRVSAGQLAGRPGRAQARAPRLRGGTGERGSREGEWKLTVVMTEERMRSSDAVLCSWASSLGRGGVEREGREMRGGVCGRSGGRSAACPVRPVAWAIAATTNSFVRTLNTLPLPPFSPHTHTFPQHLPKYSLNTPFSTPFSNFTPR